MKVTIRLLLALMVIVALGVNLWQMRRRARDMEAEIDQLNEVAQARQVQLDDFARQQVIYERFFAADERRKREFAGAESSFEQLVQKYGTFQQPGGDQLKIVTVPTYDTDECIDVTQRVYVPQEGSFQLNFAFLDEKRRPLKSASRFDPSVGKTIDLRPGESVVSFRWYRLEDQRGAVEVDGEEVFAFRCREPVSGLSYSELGASRPYTPRSRGPLQLVEFTPGAEGAKFRLTLVRAEENSNS